MDQMQKEILFSREAIDEKVKELAARISQDYEGRELIVIGILKGAFIFMADLIRSLSIPCQVDFARIASYGAGSVSSGKVILMKDIEMSIKGKDILIVEDIVDTGITLSYFVEWLKERNPRSLKVCAFLDKRGRRKVFSRRITWVLPSRMDLSSATAWISMKRPVFCPTCTS